jgi:hypothetical protein
MGAGSHVGFGRILQRMGYARGYVKNAGVAIQVIQVNQLNSISLLHLVLPRELMKRRYMQVNV